MRDIYARGVQHTLERGASGLNEFRVCPPAGQAGPEAAPLAPVELEASHQNAVLLHRRGVKKS